MPTISNFRDMVLWQQAYDFAKGCYALSRELSALDPDQRYALAGQLSRASISIPSDIAYGQRLRGPKFAAMLVQAQGASAECETLLLLVQDLYPTLAKTASALREQNAVINNMLSALAFALKPIKKS